MPEARVAEVVGPPRAPGAEPDRDPRPRHPGGVRPQAVSDAEASKPVSAKGRTDLRQIPLVTIDGADARDFDDAVWAEKDGGAGTL